VRSDQTPQRGIRRRPSAMGALEAACFGCLAVLVAGSAIIAKEAGPATPLARIEQRPIDHKQARHAKATNETAAALATSEVEAEASIEIPEGARWFDGRLVVPERTIWMTVTAYSPHAASCAPFDDGQTATLHSVETNGMRLVAADTSILPFGSMISIPGYHEGEVVPVLDRGGKIKGNRLDVLYPTHQRALQWGVQRLPITIWVFADGSPNENPRRVR